MARLFDNASSENLEIDNAVVTTTPLTMACWFNTDNLTDFQVLMFVGDKDVSNHQWRLVLAGDEPGDRIDAVAFTPSAYSEAETTTAYTTDTWEHACGVFTSSTSRAAFRNGGSKGTNSETSDPLSADRTAIGTDADSNPGSYMSGSIAEAAIWDVALTDAEVATLGDGFSPLFVRPQNLVFYVPLIRDADEDIVGGLSLTAINTPSISVHPSIIYPTRVESRDMAAFDLVAAGVSWGEQNPTDGEQISPWTKWTDGSGALANTTGDQHWGEVSLTTGQVAHSPVKDMGSAVSREFTITNNLYGSGSGDGVISIRGDTSTFAQDAGSPAWSTYSTPTTQTWRYVQVRLDT